MRNRLARFAFLCAAGAILWLALTSRPPGNTIGTDEFRHALAFVTLVLLGAFAWRQLSLWILWFLLVAFGGAIELAQGAMGAGRLASWDDWYVDIAATTGAVLIVALYRRHKTKGAKPRGFAP